MSEVRAKLIRNWKLATIFLLAGLLVSLSLLFRPDVFDVAAWRIEVQDVRRSTSESLTAANERLASRSAVSPEGELSFAEDVDRSATAIQKLILAAEPLLLEIPIADLQSTQHPDQISETKADLRRLSELKLIYRSLRVLERLHRSRAALAEADRRTSPSLWEKEDDTFAEGARPADGLFQFWNGHRPWMTTELYSLREIDRSLGHETLPGFGRFLTSLESDLDHVSRAAMDLEIRRVDTWIEWAVRQPGSRLSIVKQDASEQVRRLNSLSSTEPALPVAEDPRLLALHRDLRRMASVASESNWE